MPSDEVIDLERVRHLARLAKQLGLSELTSDDGHVRVTVTVFPSVAVGGPPALAGQAMRALPSAAPAEELTPEERGLRAIVSPMVGVFYRAASPDAEPYAEVGTRVEEGDAIGLVEAMKVFNPIEAEFAGEVVEIVVANAEPVSVGQPLMWLRV